MRFRVIEGGGGNHGGKLFENHGHRYSQILIDANNQIIQDMLDKGATTVAAISASIAAMCSVVAMIMHQTDLDPRVFQEAVEMAIETFKESSGVKP